MDGPRDYHTEWGQSDREGEVVYDIAYMWSLKKNDTNGLIYRIMHLLLTTTYLKGKFKETLGSPIWYIFKDLIYTYKIIMVINTN